MSIPKIFIFFGFILIFHGAYQINKSKIKK